jgi:hypothetical protein
VGGAIDILAQKFLSLIHVGGLHGVLVLDESVELLIHHACQGTPIWSIIKLFEDWNERISSILVRACSRDHDDVNF